MSPSDERRLWVVLCLSADNGRFLPVATIRFGPTPTTRDTEKPNDDMAELGGSLVSALGSTRRLRLLISQDSPGYLRNLGGFIVPEPFVFYLALFRFEMEASLACNSSRISRKSSALRDRGREASVIAQMVLWNTGLSGNSRKSKRGVMSST